MMELGNMIFGHSRGEWSVPREPAYENPIGMLLDEVRDCFGEDVVYGDGFCNEVFEVRAYYWGDCTCGYDERCEAWHEANKHRDDCYQTVTRREIEAHDKSIGYRPYGSFLEAFNVDSEEVVPGMVGMTMTPREDKARDKAYDLHRQFEDATYDKWCAHFGLDRKFGAAVHCTCDHSDRWDRFASADDHIPTCGVVRPNFLHKPSGLELRWYKYPLRDSYMSRQVTSREWRAIIKECLESLNARATPSDHGSSE